MAVITDYIENEQNFFQSHQTDIYRVINFQSQAFSQNSSAKGGLT